MPTVRVVDPGAHHPRSRCPESATAATDRLGRRIRNESASVRKGHTVVQAFILIQTAVGQAAAVAQAIAGLPGVTSAEDVTGLYEVIARAEAEPVDELGNLAVAWVE